MADERDLGRPRGAAGYGRPRLATRKEEGDLEGRIELEEEERRGGVGGAGKEIWLQLPVCVLSGEKQNETFFCSIHLAVAVWS
jgi:hypothetical protein